MQTSLWGFGTAILKKSRNGLGDGLVRNMPAVQAKGAEYSTHVRAVCSTRLVSQCWCSCRAGFLELTSQSFSQSVISGFSLNKQTAGQLRKAPESDCWASASITCWQMFSHICTETQLNPHTDTHTWKINEKETRKQEMIPYCFIQVNFKNEIHDS